MTEKRTSDSGLPVPQNLQLEASAVQEKVAHALLVTVLETLKPLLFGSFCNDREVLKISWQAYLRPSNLLVYKLTRHA